MAFKEHNHREQDNDLSTFVGSELFKNYFNF